MATVTDLADAIKQGNNAQVQTILQSDPTLVNARTDAGVSMVLLAQYYQHPDIVQLLIQHNAQIDLYDASAIGDVPRASGWVAMHPELVNTFSPDGYTPLTLAAFFGNLDVVNVLLPAHADPNIASNNAMHVTPLNSAVAGNHYDVAAKLVEAGANVNAIQADGFTPLMGAAQNGNPQMVQLLLDHGADVNARVDKNSAQFANMTAAGIAQSANSTDVTQLLESHGAH